LIALDSGGHQGLQPVTADETRTSGPLSGLLVADFSRVLAGPLATMLLADMGADVIKVEGPGGDDTRTWLPPVRDGVATYYLGINRNKRSVVLDLYDPEDRALAKELARRADIVVQNFKPGGAARFELDYETVVATNPGVVYASISGFGTGNKGARIPGYDLTVQAVSGLMSLTGDVDGGPFRAGIPAVDVMTGLHTVIGILGAINARHSTGRGQHVECSLLASILSGMANQSSAWATGGVVPFRTGNSHPSLYPCEPLACADGDLVFAVGNNLQFRKMVEVLGIPELADDPRFARNEDRNHNRDELRPLLVERLWSRTTHQWFSDFIDAGVPCGPVNTVDEGVALATEVGLQPVVTVGDGDRAIPVIRHPIRYSDTPAQYRLAPPRLGEHSDEVREWLSSRDPVDRR
jgi:crotonobetainyl-CoA:carnitine CoA-transferase CaiB-like acyl-CoA transferase